MIDSRRVALVIDDDADLSEMMSLLLETAGFEVDTLRDGIDAVELRKAYDVILLDLNMPVLDGERLAGYWFLTDPKILRRVIVLSGYSRFMSGRNLPSIFASIAKPFEYENFMETVNQCANQP